MTLPKFFIVKPHRTASVFCALFLLISLKGMGQGPEGYLECGTEQSFEEPTNIAFGSDGNFKYLFNQVGPIVFSRGQFFGGPSSAKVEKAWYQTISEMEVETPSANLKGAFSTLKKHLTGESVLSARQIMQQDSIIQANISAIGIKKDIIEQSFDLVSTYVAPGTIVKIKGPPSVVNKGYTIRVGTHFWDLKYRNRIARLDRATIIYPVVNEIITVGSPLGGNIYFPDKWLETR